jgi:hypothetical protein
VPLSATLVVEIISANIGNGTVSISRRIFRHVLAEPCKPLFQLHDLEELGSQSRLAAMMSFEVRADSPNPK